ncbi:MAG: hypothetical protein GX045_07550 [Clostridiaceae bacterium]|nr:hypothetical protein [Clostridiaceae bacterium]
MKKKILLILLAVTVSIATITAATMSWFTADDDADTATFTAGTVEIEAEGIEILDEKYNNVNPGDEFNVNLKIKNKGTKNIVFRIKPKAYWEKGEADPLSGTQPEILPHDNVNIRFVINGADIDPWESSILDETIGPWLIKLDRGNDFHDLNNYTIYYVGDPLQGSYYGEPGSIDLELKVIFDGEKTTNEYQGARFHLGGIVEAIQSTNDAPYQYWGVSYYREPEVAE